MASRRGGYIYHTSTTSDRFEPSVGASLLCAIAMQTQMQRLGNGVVRVVEGGKKMQKSLREATQHKSCFFSFTEWTLLHFQQTGWQAGRHCIIFSSFCCCFMTASYSFLIPKWNIFPFSIFTSHELICNSISFPVFLCFSEIPVACAYEWTSHTIRCLCTHMYGMYINTLRTYIISVMESTKRKAKRQKKNYIKMEKIGNYIKL